ncbi:hypothetical protein BHU11_01950 [Tannerella sp. oral taxon 808]|nr:hypothetical protein BHU11_01950 [Tannerella sp. oral taxon 808]
MSKLNIDQKTVIELFSDKRSDFLIPDYQRPYAWSESECQTLWDDLFAFAIPDNNIERFNDDSDEYYLGPIVTFENKQGKQEVIDGQQRLTTLLLLLRAFYERSFNQEDQQTKNMREMIEQCIWKTNAFKEANKNALKIDSQVATDEDKGEFLEILKSGHCGDGFKSRYAENYRFFEKKIDAFLSNYPSYFRYLPVRILNNCILLPIEADNQDTALQIFSTLNDRGKPLSDADIFKAQCYKHYAAMGQKDVFIDRWKRLEESALSTFRESAGGSPMDELFTRYMYYQLALQGNTNTSTEALRKFYERDNYALLKKEQTLEHIEALADFWSDVRTQNKERFSDKILRSLFVLNHAPNGMWTYLVSVYFLHHRQPDGMLEEAPFFQFLERITAFIWAYTLTNPGVNALRTPAFQEMAQIVRGQTVTFANFRFERENFISVFRNYRFHNQRQITKSMITWWAFQFDGQALLDLGCSFHIEHIYARNRAEMEPTAAIRPRLELLGNKSLLEQRINIRASDYRFADKVKYYKGLHKKKAPTRIYELLEMADQQTDFTEDDIVRRNERILNGFVDYLDRCGLLKE